MEHIDNAKKNAKNKSSLSNMLRVFSLFWHFEQTQTHAHTHTDARVIQKQIGQRQADKYNTQ